MRKNKSINKINCLKIIMTLLICICLFKGEAEAAGKNLSTATEIDLNKNYSGTLMSNSQKDYYKFSISKNSIIKISAETGGHDEHCTVNLLDSKGNAVTDNAGEYLFTTDDYSNWGYQNGSEQCGLNAGTYYIYVDKAYGPDCDYTFKVKSVVKSSSSVKVAGYENEYRNKAVSFKVGNKLTSVAANGFNSMDWDECHFYKFKVEKKRTVILNFYTPVTDDNNEVWFYLYNSSGEAISNLISIDDDSEENTATLKKTLSAGTYYIGVSTPDSYVRYTVKTAYKPYATKITNLASKNKSITVKWKEKSGITGYQIQYSQKSNFKNAKKVKVSADNTSKKIKGLKAGKKYYVRIRTYKTAFEKNYYSDWSSKKSITVKK